MADRAVTGNFRRAIRAVAVSVLAVSVLGTGAAWAQTPPPPPPAPVSCATPPSGVTATAQVRDRFVGLWAPRVADKAFLDRYVDQPGVPPEILQEGFHGLAAVDTSWLIACLVDRLIATTGIDGSPPGVVPSAPRVLRIQASLSLLVFAKAEIDKLRAAGSKTTPVTQTATPASQASVTAATEALAATTVTTPALLDPAQVPVAQVLDPTSELVPATTDAVRDLIASQPASLTVDAAASVGTVVSSPVPAGPVNHSTLVTTGLNGLISVPALQPLLDVLASLVKDVLDLPKNLAANPPFVLGGFTYRVCAESATLTLRCTIPIPVAVPVPVDVTGDLLPDVLAHLAPAVNIFALTDASAQFSVTRLSFGPAGPLPVHVFAVYDPVLTGKRLEVGFDGRASTIAQQTTAKATLKNAGAALTGDVNLQFQLTHQSPGAVSALTAAVKTLVPQGLLKPAKEADPITGAIQFQPVPTSLTADLRLRRQAGSDQTTIALTSSVATRIDAQLNRDITSLTPKSHQEIRGLIDKLPTKATVDLLRQGDVTNIHYFANAGIAHVAASDRLVPDIAKPQSYTESIYDVLGVPTDVTVRLSKGSDVLYTGSSPVTQASFSKGTFTDGILQTSVLGVAKQLPTRVQITNAAGPDTTTVTYDADASLGEVTLAMFERASDQASLLASAKGLPKKALITSTRSTGLFDYTADGPIAVIDVKATRGGGSTLPLAGDHLTYLKNGGQAGLELVLSGLRAAHAEPGQKALASLTLDPGGQPFKIIVDMTDPNVLVNVDISNLPSTIAVTVDPASGKATYSASSVITSVAALFLQRATGMVGLVELTDVPKTIDMTFATSGSSPQVTYSASSSLGKLHALYIEKPGGAAFDAVIDSLPPFFTVAGNQPLLFDARTAPAAPPASSSIGKITFSYASNGVFAAPPTPDDHALLNVEPAATRAALAYTGLRFLSVGTAGKELHVDLRNTQKRLFRAFVTTPDLKLEGFIDGVPDEVKLDMVGQTVKYRATSPVDQIAVEVDRLNGETFAVDVKGIPAAIDLVFDSAASKVTWTASSAVTSLGVVARFGPPSTGVNRTFDAALGLTGIPASWNASYGAGHPRFQGVSGPIGTLSARFTNHGVVTTLAGDHLSAVFDSVSGDLDASLRISNLSLADFEKLANGFRGDLNMGNGSPFGLNAQVTLPASRLSVTGTISNLPSALHVESTDGVFKYTGNTNPTINLAASYGSPAALAATPGAPVVHGLGVRDGKACSPGCTNAVKANVFLTGFPRELDFNPPAGTYSVKKFSPAQPLLIDARLTALVPSPLNLQVSQAGIPANVDFTYGPTVSTTLPDGTAQTKLGYVASAALGKLTATASFADNEAYFEASSVPSSLLVQTSFGADTKTIGVTLGSPISQIKAMFRHVGDVSFAAGAQLDDIPTSVNLVLGKQDGGQGIAAPVFTYSASSAGLDLTAFAMASLFGGDIKAQVELDVDNFGQTVSAGLAGKTLSIASNPPTGSFNLLASGVIKASFSLDFDFAFLENRGTLDLQLDIFRLNIAFKNMTNLKLTGGITSAIEGNYGEFTFAERSNLKITVEDRLVIDTGVGDVEIFDFGPVTFDVGNVIGNFRMATNHLGTWFSLPTPIPCLDPFPNFIDIDVELKPHPHGTTSGPSFTVTGASAEGSPPAHIVTINPFGILPDFVLDIIARFASPLGGDQGLGVSC